MKRHLTGFLAIAALVVAGSIGLVVTHQAQAVDVDNTEPTANCTPNCNNSSTGWYAHTVTTTTQVTPPAPPPPPPPVITYGADTAKKTAFTSTTVTGICENETQTWYVTPWAQYSNGTFVKDQNASAALVNEETWEKSAHKALTGTWYDYSPSTAGGANTTGQLTYTDKTSIHSPPPGLSCP